MHCKAVFMGGCIFLAVDLQKIVHMLVHITAADSMIQCSNACVEMDRLGQNGCIPQAGKIET